MLRITEVVKHLLIINIIMYFGSMLMGDPSGDAMYNLINEISGNQKSWGRYQLAMFFPSSDYFRPYQIITHMFMHGSISHLFFNMFALFMFGPQLESLWGPKRFLTYYLITGFGALGLYLLVQYFELNFSGMSPFYGNVPMLGASGAVFGILMGFGLKFPNQRIMLLIPPIPMKAIYFVTIYAGIELFLGLGGFRTGVAHFAHVGGALFGLLLITFSAKY